MRHQRSNGPRRAPKQERSRETVEAILEATARVLVRDGYEGATTNRIAETSGYGVGSLYDYFPNKESLVAALMSRHAENMVEMVGSRFEAHAESPPVAAVRAWVEGCVEAHLSNPELHKVLIERAQELGDPGRVGEAEEHVARLVGSYLKKHAAEIRPDDTSLAAFVISQTVISLAHKAVADRPESLEDGRLAEEVTGLVLGYLTPAGAKP